MKALIAYASKHGATQEVAERIAGRLRDAGVDCVTQDAGAVTSLAGVDAVIVGSGIYAGSWLRPAAAFVDRFATELAGTQVWAFSCGPIGKPPQPAGRPASADAVARRAGAAENKLFGGVVDRARLALWERGLLRAMKVTSGDFRDWGAIDDWADAIAASLRAPGPEGRPLSDFWALQTGEAPSTMGGTCELSVHDLGVLRVLSGQLEACDPFVNLGDEHAFVTSVPPGDYPVRVTIADISDEHDGSHLREAYLSVVLDDGEPAQVELIVPEGRPQPPSGDYYGVPVDAGTVAFVDHVAAQSDMPQDTSSWYDELFDSGEPGSWFELMDSAEHLIAGSANIVLPRARRGENVVLTHSGWGDGYYPVYRTLGEDGQLLGIHIDLEVAGHENQDA